MNDLSKILIKQLNTQVYLSYNENDNIIYGVIIYKNSLNKNKILIIRCIKGNHVNKLHVESLITMLGRRFGTRWGNKIIIIHEDKSFIKNEARVKQKDLIFVPISNIFFYLNSIKRNFNNYNT
jgi:hypothetical protein